MEEYDEDFLAQGLFDSFTPENRSLVKNYKFKRFFETLGGWFSELKSDFNKRVYQYKQNSEAGKKSESDEFDAKIKELEDLLEEYDNLHIMEWLGIFDLDVFMDRAIQ